MHSLIDRVVVDEVRAALGEGAAGASEALRAIEAADRGEFAAAAAGFATVLERSSDLRLLFAGFQYHFRRSELDVAERFVRRRLELAPRGSKVMARALTNLGLIHLFRDELVESEAAQRAAIEIDRALGDEAALARDLGNLALVPEKRGDLDEAERLNLEALAIAEGLGERGKSVVASMLGNLGDIALARGKREEARALWVRAVPLFAELGKEKFREETEGKLRGLGEA